MTQNGNPGNTLDHREDRDGLQEQVVLLYELSKKLDEYFSLRKGGRNL